MARLSLKTKTTTNDLVVNIGTSVNDKTGDPLRTAFGKLKDSIDQAEANFIELYATTGADAPANELVNGSQVVSLGPTGVLTMPDGLTVADSVIGYASSNTITEETVGGITSETTANQSQIEIATNSVVIARKTTVTVDDGVTTSVDEAGSRLEVNNLGTFAKHYVEPDGPSNSSYFQFSTSNLGAVIEGIDQAPGSTTTGRITVTQGVVDILASVGAAEKHWVFDRDGILTLPSDNYLETIDANLTIGSQGVVTIRSDAGDQSTTKAWVFNKSGTITTPLMLPTTFTAVLDNDHRTVGDAIVGDPWQYTVSFVVGPGGIVETQIDNPDWPTNPGYASGDEFEFTEEDHGIPGFAFAVTLNAVSEVPETGFVVLLAVTPPPEYPSTVASLGAIKLSANTSNWVFDTNGTLHYPDGSFGSTAFIGDATRLYGNVDEDVNVIVSHRTSVSAEAMDGTSGDILIVDTTFVDDIKVVQAGWEINAGTEQAPIWLTVNSASDVGTPFYYHINVPGFDFVSGSTYTFRNPTAISQTWTFNNSTGTLIAPGGAILSSETAVVGEGNAYRDFSIELATPDGLNEHRWTFSNTAGDLTLPNSLKFNDGVSTITALDPAQTGGVGGLSIAGKERTFFSINSDTYSYSWDFRSYGSHDYSTTLKPAMQFPGGGWLQEDFTDSSNQNIPVQLGSQGSITLTAILNDLSPTEHNWVFGRDGNLTLPTGGDILDSNGTSVLGGGGGTTLPSNTTGYLKNDGSGTLSWDAITVPTTLGDLGITAGSNGQFLQTDGAGSYTWSDVSTITAAGAAGSTVTSTSGTFMLDFMGWSRIANTPGHTDWDQPYNIYLAFNIGNSEGLALHTKFLSMTAGTVFNFTFNHTTATGSYLQHTFNNLTLSNVVDSGGGNIVVTVEENLYTLLQTYFDSGAAAPTVDVIYTAQFQNGQPMAIIIPAITAKTWTFTNDSVLTLPDYSSIQTVTGNLSINSGNYVSIDTTGNGQIEIGRNSTNGVVILGQKSATANVVTDGDLIVEAGVYEKFVDMPTPATGVVIHNCANGHIFYHTSPDADWTVNLTNFNSIVGRATSVTLVISQGATGYYPTALQIGGTAQTINWQGNIAPTPSVSRIDVVSFSILCTAPSTYTVLGQLTGF